MKNVLLFLCLFAHTSSSSQTDDSLVTQKFHLLIKSSLKCLDTELYKEAHALTNAAEKLVQDSLHLPNALLGHCYFNRARIYRRKKDYDSAVLWYVKSKESWVTTLGKNHPLYLNTIYQMGLMYREIDDFKKAVSSFQDLKDLISKSVGKTDSSYLESLNSLGLTYMEMEEFKKAEESFLEAYSIQIKLAGFDHPQIANTLNNLALLYKKTGQYEGAIDRLKEVLTIREKNPGKRSLIYTITLGNLASLYKEIGNYEKAEDCYLEALDLRKHTFGETHWYTLGSLENIAGLYREMGDKEKAITLYKQVIDGRKNVLGINHPAYGIGLNHLANTYKDLNKPKEALPLYKEVLRIRLKNLPTTQKEYIETLNQIASIYIALDSFELALSHCLHSLHFCDSVFGKSTTLYATCLHELGLLETQLGYCNEAELHFTEASSIFKEILGENHYKYAESLDKIGSLYFDLGQYEKAEPFFIQSKKIKEKVLGNKHNLYLESLDQLGEFYEIQKKYSSSDPLFSELSATDQELLSSATGFLTEKELENYTQSFLNRSDKLGSYVLLRTRQIKDQGNLTTYVLNNNLFYKGFLLTSAKQLNKQASITNESLKLNSELKNIRRHLGREYLNPFAKSSVIKKLEEEANQIEKQLRKMVSGFSEFNESIKWQQIQHSLSEREAAIEFIYFNDITDSLNKKIKYAAIVIKPSIKTPYFIPLFEESALASLMPNHSNFQSAFIANLYTSHRGSQFKLTKKRPDLYELIWEPLDSVLQDVDTVYYSPSGLLHRLNLNAIPIKDKIIIADRYKMINVNSTRQLGASTQVYSTNNNALLLGGIDYDHASENNINQSKEQAQNIEGLLQAELSALDNGDEFPYLPGTAEEVDSAGKIMQSVGMNIHLRKGQEATEAYFKSFGQENKESPRIILLATHGYFYQNTINKNETNEFKKTEPVYKTSTDPMFRSGLILAGGNKAWQGGYLNQNNEDGILTAYEISQMNLSNTELVMLSACETGLGDIKGSEGVYGLQRAFRIAGVKHLIMSLWKVSDHITTILMTEFYKNWLLENMTIPTAFDTAQKSLRDRFVDPYLWAGFILVE